MSARDVLARLIGGWPKNAVIGPDLEAADRVIRAGYRRADDLETISYEELVDLDTMEQREALPAVYHRPVFDDLIRPRGWFCEVCWLEGEITGWPCEPAIKGGLEIADALGLKAHR